MRNVISVFISPEFFDVNNNDESTPEKTLLAAILWRAYWDLQPNIEMQYRLSAVRWFEGIAEDKCPFTYKEVADILSISASQQELIKNAVNVIKFQQMLPAQPRRKGDPNYNAVIHRVRHRVCA